MNRAVFVLVAILFLLSISSITGFVHPAKAAGETIYINADGSISPSGAPIYTADNITYTLTGNVITNVYGIWIKRNNTVLNGAGYTVTGSGNAYGIALANVGNVTVTNMMITNFTEGISLSYSSNCTVSGNNVTANSQHGIWLKSSSSNTVSGNTVAHNGNGIRLEYYSDNNTVSGNNVTANTYYGILFSFSSNNKIYQNNFIGNTQSQAYSSNSANVWDNGSKGNYWSDYLTRYPSAVQVDSSGVWNTPYEFDANNTDHYPLTVPIVVVPEFPSIQATMLFMLLTLLTVIIYKKRGRLSAR